MKSLVQEFDATLSTGKTACEWLDEPRAKKRNASKPTRDNHSQRGASRGNSRGGRGNTAVTPHAESKATTELTAHPTATPPTMVIEKTASTATPTTAIVKKPELTITTAPVKMLARGLPKSDGKFLWADDDDFISDNEAATARAASISLPESISGSSCGSITPIQASRAASAVDANLHETAPTHGNAALQSEISCQDGPSLDPTAPPFAPATPKTPSGKDKASGSKRKRICSFSVRRNCPR